MKKSEKILLLTFSYLQIFSLAIEFYRGTLHKIGYSQGSFYLKQEHQFIAPHVIFFSFFITEIISLILMALKKRAGYILFFIVTTPAIIFSGLNIYSDYPFKLNFDLVNLIFFLSSLGLCILLISKRKILLSNQTPVVVQKREFFLIVIGILLVSATAYFFAVASLN